MSTDKIFKLDPDIPIVQNEAAIMTTLAAELFLRRLAEQSQKICKARGKNTIRYEDVADARSNDPSLAFLKTIIPWKKKNSYSHSLFTNEMNMKLWCGIIIICFSVRVEDRIIYLPILYFFILLEQKPSTFKYVQIHKLNHTGNVSHYSMKMEIVLLSLVYLMHSTLSVIKLS